MGKVHKRFVLTTPIYYVNSYPHLGHTYTTMVADAFARFYRQRGFQVLFTTGTDEHGAKVQKAAQEKKMSEKEYVDQMASIWKNYWQKLDIAFDDFIRTTEQRHVRVVQHALEFMRQNGSIYPGTYAGWYCVPCETFFKEEELGKEKTCPNSWCRRPVEWTEEKGYYFKLSNYQQALFQHYKNHPEAVRPDFRYNEVISFIQSGLRDVYITRSSFNWGIPVPFDKGLVTYVWFDALLNYLTVTGYRQEKGAFESLWPVNVHFIAKDILRFHAVIWPAMLMALNLKLPPTIFSHGFWLFSQEKMSKSKGLFVTPEEIIEKLSNRYGAPQDVAIDAIRFYLFFEVPLGQDGSFTWESFFSRYETLLANDLGNLVQRVGKMIWQYESGKKKEATMQAFLQQAIEKTAMQVEDKMKAFQLQEALREIFELCRLLNQQVEREKPWEAYKTNREKGRKTLYNLKQGIKALSFLLTPFLPHVAKRIEKLFGFELQRAQNIKEALQSKEEPLAKGFAPIFPKPSQRKSMPAVTTTEAQKGETITLEDFSRLDLRTARVISAEPVAATEKLLKIRLDAGGQEIQVIAGLRPHYTAEQLIGKCVVLLKNLKPAKIRGELSEGMLLAADVEGKPVLLTLDREAPTGAKIR